MAAVKHFTVGGIGAQPGVDDVARVAHGLQIELDTAGAERIKKESPPPKSFQAEAPAADLPAPASNLLTPAQARAFLVTRLMSLMAGKSGVRLQVAEFLRDLLNASQQQALPAVPAAGGEPAASATLVAACHGLGTSAGGQPLAEALAAAGLTPPGLSTAEREVLSSGATATAGVGSLVIVSGRQAVAAATAVAALSFEAFGAQVKSLEPDAQEAVGSKADAAAADQLRSLLEGSKVAGSRKGTTPQQQQQLFSSTPQVLGAASSALAAAYTAVRSEVQSGAMPCKNGVSPNVPSPALPDTLAAAAKALLQLAASSLARSAAISSTVSSPTTQGHLQQLATQVQTGPVAAAQQQLVAVCQQIAGDLAAWPGLQAAQLGVAAVEALHQAVAVEGLTAAAALRLAEGPPPSAAPAAAEAAPATAEEGDGKKKDKKKDKKGAAGLVLGKGTALVRSLLESSAAGGGSNSSSSGADAATAASTTSTTTSSSSTLTVAGEPLDLVDAAAVLPAGLARVAALLDPSGAAVGKLLEEVRCVVEANQARRKPKVPKGARDFMPEQMAIREKAFTIITGVFKRHGAVSIDTPVFELRETLMGKYGEDSKLIYDLADQGGELLSLRYDLTVPFARYVAVHAIGNIKRYHIGKVYRRDQPQMNRGRFREFFQCDFDIAGSYAIMVPDAEVLKVLVEILSSLQLGAFTIKLNHRKLLDAMLAIAGVPAQKFRAICSAIDKLDKEPWEAVRCEMVQDKGLPGPVADKIGEFVVLKGEPRALLATLQDPSHPLAQHPDSSAALTELSTLFDFLDAMGALGPISFDLSLARGLDYYTGVIYEAVLEGGNVGSIAAGGRYDKLVGMFSGKDVPAVGVSIGIERVFAIMEGQAKERAAAAGTPIRATETQVLVASIGNNMQAKRMDICSRLWAGGIKAEFGFKPNPKMGDQLNYALEQGIPFLVLFGEDELTSGKVKVKDMGAKTEELINLEEVVVDLQRRLAAVQQ